MKYSVFHTCDAYGARYVAQEGIKDLETTDFGEAVALADELQTDGRGGYVRREDGSTLAPDGTWIEPRRGPGRPRKDAPHQGQPRRSITISDAHAEKARKIGGGNLSEGIRQALDAYSA